MCAWFKNHLEVGSTNTWELPTEMFERHQRGGYRTSPKCDGFWGQSLSTYPLVKCIMEKSTMFNKKISTGPWPPWLCNSHYRRVCPIYIPLNHYKIPLTHYRIPLNYYKIPLNHYKIPLNHHKIPDVNTADISISLPKPSPCERGPDGWWRMESPNAQVWSCWQRPLVYGDLIWFYSDLMWFNVIL